MTTKNKKPKLIGTVYIEDGDFFGHFKRYRIRFRIVHLYQLSITVPFLSFREPKRSLALFRTLSLIGLHRVVSDEEFRSRFQSK